MSRNLLKGGYVIVTNDEKVTIDSNETIAKRLEALSLKKIQEHSSDENDEDGFSEGFTEGIDPYQVAQLVDENSESDVQRRQEVLQQEDEMLRSAKVLKQESEEMLTAAKAEADAMIQEAAAIKEEAHQLGFDAGHEEGYSNGYSEGMQAAEQEIKAKEAKLASEYKAKEQALEQEYQKLQDNMETELVEVLTEVYSHVLGIELSDSNEMILMLIKKAMQQLDSGNSYIIHVAQPDIMTVKSSKSDISRSAGIPEDKIEIIEDNTLAKNGCMIESDVGIIDCGLDTQLNLLKKHLKLISFQK